MMHVCFFCNEYPPGVHGGVGSFTRTLARGLIAAGHMVTVLGVYSGRQFADEDDSGVRVLRLPSTRIPKAGFLLNGAQLRRALVNLHRARPIDVLEGPENAFALLRRPGPGQRVIRMNGGHHFFSTTLGGRPRPWRSWLERRSFSRADHLAAVSRFVAEETRRLLELGDVPVEILPNPVDVQKFAPRCDVGEEPGTIVYAGTLCEKKGIRQLVLAMPEILRAIPDARLLVIGRDSTDPQTGRSFAALLREASRDLGGRVELLGPMEHDTLPQALARAQVLAYPSHMEAMPLAWLEGLAMGKPVVVSETGPGPEVVTDGVNGLTCDPHDPASIARQCIRLLESDQLRRTLGARARDTAVQRFSIDVLLHRNLRFYERILNPQAKAT